MIGAFFEKLGNHKPDSDNNMLSAAPGSYMAIYGIYIRIWIRTVLSLTV